MRELFYILSVHQALAAARQAQRAEEAARREADLAEAQRNTWTWRKPDGEVIEGEFHEVKGDECLLAYGVPLLKAPAE